MFSLVGKGEILGYTVMSVCMGQRFLPSQGRKTVAQTPRGKVSRSHRMSRVADLRALWCLCDGFVTKRNFAKAIVGVCSSLKLSKLVMNCNKQFFVGETFFVISAPAEKSEFSADKEPLSYGNLSLLWSMVVRTYSHGRKARFLGRNFLLYSYLLVDLLGSLCLQALPH